MKYENTFSDVLLLILRGNTRTFFDYTKNVVKSTELTQLETGTFSCSMR